MIKIRKNVFETNSSSMHTLVLTNDETWVSEKEIKEFETSLQAINKQWLIWNKDHTGYYLTIEGDSFGREFRLLTLWHAKLQYVAAAVGVEGAAALADVLRDYLGSNFLGILVTADPSEYTDNDNLCPCTDYYGLNRCFGDIDHQSNGMINNAMELIDKDIKEAMKKLIFNNKYVIVVDGDETQAFDEMLTSGFMEDTYFTHIFHESHIRDEKGNYDWDHPILEFIPIKKYLNRNNDDED